MYNIIFIHKGNPDFLGYSLRQAKKFNPKTVIHLIGDESNNTYDFIDHHNILEYDRDAINFKRYYKHFSTNPYDFELFCFQRWFILKDFLISNTIEKFFHADSDVLVYFNIEEEFKKFKEFDFTLSTGSSGHCSFWNNTASLEHFCQFIMNMYTGKDNENYNKMVDHYRIRQSEGLPGGVCDMTAFRLYRLNKHAKIGETTDIINNSTYDDNFNVPTNGQLLYEMRYGAKKIEWINTIPYGSVFENKDKIKFNVLHCQGNAKNYISRIYKHKQPITMHKFLLNKIKMLLKIIVTRVIATNKFNSTK
ncbi:MAG: hypothetical protein DYG83_06010 [Candidatus Brocadia sp. AMX2]|uniref:Uncharacterized protein n=1 Tax=Candidatus Brocadia sinica JPN1 TaxID=1197129 RepID=A0ABQ0JX97_9BACT|nr:MULTISPECIES: hypothetical protein [Brocadia]MBC6932011.1 hypothetical protein [Candidatus Brocadia sp.]MBL1169464.1 hypothetical protein [Candidatus Brocadia sp. AMX1]NOG40821.1 hypothetical protein [Planctomycetota bacterium]GIK13208.1 MAG: hypothetical protein BroJett002_19150 [Candidatus Brocadia sinica]KAA0242645.1 MAG: hypothetical protein EDM70_13310 [Candidatus Brocadia sp. AMX2]